MKQTSRWYEDFEEDDRFLREQVHFDELENGLITEDEYGFLEGWRGAAS